MEAQETQNVFSMWAISGTGNVAVALPYLEERKVPLIGSTSGADPFYAKTGHLMLFNMKCVLRATNDPPRVA